MSFTSQKSSVIYAGIALVCAGFAAFLFANVLQAKGFKQEKTAPVVIATRNVSSGIPLTKQDVKTVQMAAALVPAGAVQDENELFPIDGSKPPSTPSTGILAGEFILRGRLADSKNGTALAAKVRPGFRAFAVTADGALTRSRLVFPGAIVDLVATFRDMRSAYSKVLVENVRVLSLESDVDVETNRQYDQSDADSARRATDTVVTIELTPEQAEVVALTSREGKVDLVLRGPTDIASVETAGASTATLFTQTLTGNAVASPSPAAAAAAESAASDNKKRRGPAPKTAPPKNRAPAVEKVADPVRAGIQVMSGTK
jgi:pilus assembly protein CpaB